MQAQSTRPRRPSRSRTTSNCKCGGPCFYCGRALSQNRHEHDHFPIPYRHGGHDTEPSCVECHSLKDRRIPGFHADGSVDEPVVAAIEKGMEALPPVIDASNGERLPIITWLLYERMEELKGASVRADYALTLVDEVNESASFAAWSIQRATTPEARVWIAFAFTTCLDMLDDALQRREPRGEDAA